jgi:predicted small secreted protein
MKHTLYLPFLLVSAALSQASCGGDPTAPPTSEILPVSVQTRLAVPGEVIPTTHISGGQGNVTVQVTTLGACATVVGAGVRRGSHELAIVSHVSADPAAMCLADLVARATDYQGTIASLAEGSYRVRVFESFMGATPRLIGTAVVTVSRPAA